MKHFLWILLLWVLAPVTLPAEVISSPLGGFFLDPPEQWLFASDPSPEHLVLTDASRRAVFEVYTQNLGEAQRPNLKFLTQKAQDLKTKLKAKGEEGIFLWNGQPAVMGNWEYQAGRYPVQGWVLFVSNDVDRMWTALAYAPQDFYDEFADEIISTINSFAVGQKGRDLPGPLSSLFTQSGDSPLQKLSTLPKLPDAVNLYISPDQNEMILATIERETRLLIPHVEQPSFSKAWSRYYRQIYREIREGLAPLAQIWQEKAQSMEWNPQEQAQALLAWLQSFDYVRKGGLTDLSTPWEVLKEGKGDCDSLALMYLAILDHLGQRGILMVSSTYKHAMAALDLAGDGARFPFANNNWLVAELTATVTLGQIDSTMANPDEWLGIDVLGSP